MLKSVVEAIAIAPQARVPLVAVNEVQALEGRGLQGDRYGDGGGSYRKSGEFTRRQVTLFDARFLDGSGYTLPQTRRNIAVRGDIDLMRLFKADRGEEFQIGEAVFRGVAYCDPCAIPSKQSGNPIEFREQFWGRGGLICEVVNSGLISVGDEVIAEKLVMY